MKLSISHLITLTGNWYLVDIVEEVLGDVGIDVEYTPTQGDIDAIADVIIQKHVEVLNKPLNDYATPDDRLGVSKDADAVILAHWQAKQAQDVKDMDWALRDFSDFLCKLGLPQPRQWRRS